MENHTEDIARHDVRLDQVEKDIVSIKNCLERIENDLKWYGKVVFTAKTLFFLAVAVLTLKFSDAETLLKGLVNKW